MTPSPKVTSLELSKRLKSLGVSQESLWYWIKITPFGTNEKYYVVINHNNPATKKDIDISAFTSDELMDSLPWTVNTKSKFGVELVVIKDKDAKGYCATYDDGNLETSPDASAKTLSDALAKLKIHLIKEGIIKP